MNISDIYKVFISCKNVSTDTRTIQENDLFFGLNGENFDGNRFVAKAFENGAKYAIIDNPEYKINDQCILVEDSLVCLQELSKYHRQQLTNLKLIAIVGSNGKTTTKELVHNVLSSKYKTYSTYKNWNNEIGVPLNLLKLDETYDFAVIELGANHLEEHAFLCNIALPDYGIVTNCGKDHLEGYGSIEGVIQSNKELFDFMRTNDGIAFVNADDKTVLDISKGLESVFYGETAPKINGLDVQTGFFIERFPFVSLKISDNKTLNTKPFYINSHLFGKFQLANIMAAVTIGKYFGVEESLIKNAIENYIPTNNRSQIISWNGNTVLLDAYNANPSSMLPMVNDFDLYPKKNKVVVLGDMFELGETSDAEHKAMVEALDNRSFKEVILVGSLFGKFKDLIDCQHFLSSDEVYEYLKEKNYTKHYFLAKGSRGMKIEKAFKSVSTAKENESLFEIPDYTNADSMIWKSIPIKECGENLVEISNLSERIIVKPAYLEQGIQGAIKACYVRESIANKLLRVVENLPLEYNLLVLDAWRPLEVQQALFDDFSEMIKTENPTFDESAILMETQKYVSLASSNPQKPSPHYTGGAIDLTIITKEGELLDMGTTFDEFRPIANTRYLENNRSETSLEALENRRLLYHLMAREGFTNYPYEWWHFDYGNQFWAKKMNTIAIYGGIEPKN